MTWWDAHTHSTFSTLDGMASVQSIVEQAALFGHPAIGLTDHGVMGGNIRLYKTCQAAGIQAFPGIEFWATRDVDDHGAAVSHIGMLALDARGYRALSRLSTMSYTRKREVPIIDYADLAAMAEVGDTDHIVLLTGCVSHGLLPKAVLTRGKEAGAALLRSLAAWCVHTYVELQPHGGSQLTQSLVEIADEAGVPVLVTTDAHYLSPQDRAAHGLLSSFRTDAPPGCIDNHSAHDLRSAQAVEEALGSGFGRTWRANEESAAALLRIWDLELPSLDKYRLRVPDTVNNPDEVLACKVRGTMAPAYTARLEAELQTISETGMASYFLLVSQVTDWCAKNRIFVRARGSANGSLVCHRLGITSVDPVKWGCLFERFLTRDRAKPPDIDLDVDALSRDRVIEYLQRWDCTQIANYNRLSIDVAGRGSLLVKYLAAKRHSDPVAFSGLKSVTTVDALSAINPGDAALLRQLDEHRVWSSPAAHAAGYALGSNDQPIEDYLPRMVIRSSGRTVTQMTMEDVEDAGYMKLDVLGLRNLTTWVRACEYLGEDPWSEWVPPGDSRTFSMIRKGRPETLGIFQLEGWTAAKGCSELGVRTVEDLIAVMALYRPACIDSGATARYLDHRSRKTLPPMPEVMRRHLKPTWGIALFQDQVVATMRDLGMSAEGLNNILKAVKGKRGGTQARRILSAAQAEVASLCHGMTATEAKQIWETIEGYAGYGFNRAHAVAYGLLAYDLAYLKCHHALEFMAALLATSVGKDKEDVYVVEARRLGCRLLGPDVNTSAETWTLDKPEAGIRRGLQSVDGIGPRAAHAITDGAPFSSVHDLISRTPARMVTGGQQWDESGELSGALAALASSGALRTLGVQP